MARMWARALMALARRLPRSRITMLRLAIANIHRPGALTPSVVLSLGLGGCASTVQQARASGPGAKLDPWENWNRKVFAFNEGLDEHFLRPIATGYANVVPRFVRRGVDNFFSNAADAWSVVNNILQGKGEAASQDFARVMTNTTFGFLGVLDIASEMGLEHHYEDLGQTLGHWGFGAGAYVVWPVLGPSSVRDSIASRITFARLRTSSKLRRLNGAAWPSR